MIDRYFKIRLFIIYNLIQHPIMIGLPWDDGEMYTYATQQMIKMIWNLVFFDFIILGILGLLFLLKYLVNKPPKNESLLE